MVIIQDAVPVEVFNNPLIEYKFEELMALSRLMGQHCGRYEHSPTFLKTRHPSDIFHGLGGSFTRIDKSGLIFVRTVTEILSGLMALNK